MVSEGFKYKLRVARRVNNRISDLDRKIYRLNKERKTLKKSWRKIWR